MSVGPTSHGKTHLAEQMIRELGEKHRGKVAVLLLGSKPADDRLIYPGAPQGEIISEEEVSDDGA